MPLLKSPVDGSPMRRIHRYGIEIDVCPATGGVWLDKGELEKMLGLMQEDAGTDTPSYIPPQQQQRHRYDDDDRDDDDHRRYRQNGYYGSGKYHKKSKMSRIMDLLDF